MTPRKTRSLRKPPAEPNQPPNRRRSNPCPPEPTCPLDKGKNPRKRSPDTDEEAGNAPPSKKRATNRSPPHTAGPSTVSRRAVSRRSTRKTSSSARKEVQDTAEPDSDVIVIDNDGHPYVAYDDAPHLHPPPRRRKPKPSDEPILFWEKVKGCSIKPCWTPTQQRRCRTLQTDEAVADIGWKKVRKWMQAVRCGLCGETQVLRDLTKGCFNLEHWWRHLRIRHGIKRDEEIEEKGEEKYNMLPIKDHVCVGTCSTCGEGGEAVSRRQQNPSARQARTAVVEHSDPSSLSSVDTIPSPSQISSLELMTSTPHVRPSSPNHTPVAGPSNRNHPPAHSVLYTVVNGSPQYRYDSFDAPTTFLTSSCRDLPTLVTPSRASYISDPNSHLSALSPLPAPHNEPLTSNLNTSTPEPERTSTPSTAYTISDSPSLPPFVIAPPRSSPKRDIGDEYHFMTRRSPAGTVAQSPTVASATPATPHTRPKFLNRPTSALLLTQPPAAASTSFIQPSPSMTSSRSPAPRPTTSEAIAVVPSLSNYLWPPANKRPAGAPSPPRMTAASWEEDSEGDTEDEIEAPQTLHHPRTMRAEDTKEMEIGENDDHATRSEMEARLLHHFSVSAWKESEIAGGLLTTATGLVPQTGKETAGPGDSTEQLPHPRWAFIKQEESEPELETDEDEDMVDELLD